MNFLRSHISHSFPIRCIFRDNRVGKNLFAPYSRSGCVLRMQEFTLRSPAHRWHKKRGSVFGSPFTHIFLAIRITANSTHAYLPLPYFRNPEWRDPSYSSSTSTCAYTSYSVLQILFANSLLFSFV